MSPVSAPALRRLMPALLLLAGMLWLMRDTAAAMVAVWIRSETFNHAFLVPPIALWLVWRRREVLASLPSRAEPWLLLPMAGACVLWLLGELASVAAASQFALVSLVVLSVPALFGRAVARALTFPLAFLYFSVPFGEFTVPQLMEWTADFTVVALRLSGIPVYREGLQFVIPSGSWSVVEACSGVRYLIASFMVGTLFAYLNYRSTRRRVIFGLVALVVPIVANWARAYMIVMIGHLSSNELAVGVDHLIYGWVFFGVVIGLVFFIGARWAEPDLPAPAPLAAGPSDGRRWPVAVACAALVVGTQAWLWQLDHAEPAGEPRLSLPAVLPAGGPARTEPALPWTPAFRNPSAAATAVYGEAARPTWLWIAYYRRQGPDRKLVSSVNGLVSSDDKVWAQTEQGTRAAGAGLPAWRTASLRRGHNLDAAVSTRLRVWHLYWVGGRWTTSDVRAKVWQAVDRLLGRGDDGAVVLLVTPWAAGVDADAVLEKFAREALGPVEAALATARDTRGSRN